MKQIQARIAAITPVTKDLMTSLLTPDEPLSLITHTDFWANNLLFRENECVILDWQMVGTHRILAFTFLKFLTYNYEFSFR